MNVIQQPQILGSVNVMQIVNKRVEETTLDLNCNKKTVLFKRSMAIWKL